MYILTVPLGTDVKYKSYLILKLLCPVSISWYRGEVVSPFVVILVHCMKGMTAVKRDGQGARETERGGDLGVSKMRFLSLTVTGLSCFCLS